MPQCPVCNSAVSLETTPTVPFCSDRCRLIDLGRWLTLTFLGLVISVAVQRQALGRDWPPPGRAVRIAGYLMCLPLGPHGVTGVWTWWL